ncbi:hypothetical protein [Thiocystis violacea]|uniref:hypothetical protein n=1 Tax=Thiocystis violacea TaxID=13725 RepID=UPI001903223F|nr:hypothetical protein [Thiocystis violacea]MBK1719302.1 hypothetical protein [Thiocystis violacea]
MSLPSGSADERRLIKCFRRLEAADRETLLAFADFLAQRLRSDPTESVAREPRIQARPEHETVVGAIKRLSQAYDMLERGALLNETSVLMSSHLLQGRAASEVIDELEALFARHYQDYRAKFGSQG